MKSIVSLPMYDWPETRADTDAEWVRIRSLFERAGIDAPENLVRRNADLPPVHGGIRDGQGRVIAPDPATLPPDELDFQTVWKHPKLLLAQTCWGPLEQGLAEHVIVVGQPSYDGIEGGKGIEYSSAILMRRSEMSDGTKGVAAPADGRPSSRRISSAASVSPTTASIPCPGSSHRHVTWKQWAKAWTYSPSTSRPARIEPRS